MEVLRKEEEDEVDLLVSEWRNEVVVCLNNYNDNFTLEYNFI